MRRIFKIEVFCFRSNNKVAAIINSIAMVESRIIVFSVLLTLLIPSVLCSFYLFLQFIFQKQIRKKENNHIIICLVIINFMQVCFRRLIFKKMTFIQRLFLGCWRITIDIIILIFKSSSYWTSCLLSILGFFKSRSLRYWSLVNGSWQYRTIFISISFVRIEKISYLS